MKPTLFQAQIRAWLIGMLWLVPANFMSRVTFHRYCGS
jgi:hypothetical protein